MTLTFKKLNEAATQPTDEHTYDIIVGTLEEIERNNIKASQIPSSVTNALKESIHPQKINGGETKVRSSLITMATMDLLTRLEEDKHPAVKPGTVEQIATDLFPYHNSVIDYALPKRNKAMQPKGLPSQYNR